MPVLDRLNRPLRNLRISVTDRCNLRCQYCMPESEYVWLPRANILRFEEIEQLADLFLELGVEKIRLTGGEPLLRRNIEELVRLLAQKPGLTDLALTTNGILLAERAATLKASGLHRITVSLDTLRLGRFHALTRSNAHQQVLDGIEAARLAGLEPLKLDTVVIRDVNDDELAPLIEFGKRMNAEVRFIEYMDVGGATRWSAAAVVSQQEMLAALERRYGRIEPLLEEGDQASAPAERFRLSDGTIFGVIASTTTPFCRACDRSRLTADGMWYLCLYARTGTDLRQPLRQGVTPDQLRSMIVSTWQDRTDRGAEDRLTVGVRTSLIPIGELRKDAHLEMHTRGG